MFNFLNDNNSPLNRSSNNNISYFESLTAYRSALSRHILIAPGNVTLYGTVNQDEPPT